MKIKTTLMICATAIGFSLAQAALDAKTEGNLTVAKTFKDSKELRNDYPNIDDGSTRLENKKILCPFHRLMERAGKYDSSAAASVTGQILVKVADLVAAAEEFGCKVSGCKPVAHAVSAGQNTHLKDRAAKVAQFGKVNVTRLHKARGIAHDCGLTFEKGGEVVSDARRDLSLQKLKALADAKPQAEKGTLLLADIQQVKQEICALEGSKSTFAGEFEMKLIFNYLGGNDRGFIEYSDVERFLHAKMPLTKSIDGI
jgi:hypothetical protein